MTKQLQFLLKQTLLISVLQLITIAGFSQTGPGGVGNSEGTNGQPKNILWLDASKLGLADGADVSTWTDLSGNTNNATQTTTNNMPIMATGIINGKPVVRFRPTTPNRTQTYLQYDGSALINSGYSILSVAARRSLGFKMILGGTNGTGNQNLHWGWRDNTQFTLAQWGNDINRTLSVNTANTFSVFSSVRRSSTSPWGRAIFQDGAVLGATDNNTTLLTSYDGASIGRLTTNYYDIDVAELILYSSALNEAQRLIVDNYLSAKYNLSLGVNQFYSNSTYNYDVIGIGSSDGTVKHAETSGSGGGIYLKEYGNSLDETNEFVFAGNDNTAVGEVATDLPTLPSGNLTGRSQRVWYIDRTTGTTTNASIGFNPTEIGLGVGADNQIFYLLYRTGTSGSFSTVSGAQGVINNGMIWFNVTNANLIDGYYTIARSNLTGRTWYSYKSGNWDDWQTWSLEQGGADIVNPDHYTPTTSPTTLTDKVEILHPYTVTVSSNNKQNALLNVVSGTINFASTTGHRFDIISGQGTIRLSADNFPDGDASAFNSSAGGTVQYNGTSYALPTARTFNNLVILLNSTSDVLTLLSNYTTNGYVNIQRGTLQINDNASTNILSLSVAEDFTVYSEGKLTVGTGNTIGSYSIPGTIPPVGQYHSIYHQITLGGNLLNDGIIRLTNLSAPMYNQFASDGAVTLTFTGAANKQMLLHNTTDLYNLIIDKGTDRTYILEVDADNSDYFRLFGPNVVGRTGSSPFTAANPEIRKALWIKNGTLKLIGNVVIPSLSEGSSVGGNGDYAIPGNAALWIAGQNVKVFSTARTASAELMSGTTGVNDGTSNQALSVYGEFRITDGYFNTRNSAGFIFWPDASAVVKIEGGLCDVAQFRSANGVNGGKTSFVMSGGELMVRGNRQFTYNLDFGTNFQVNPDGGGEITGSYPTFGIVDPSGVFQMSGGKIYVTDDSGNNTYASNAFCIQSDVSNHIATGGTVYMLMNNGNNYDIYTKGPLYNLILDKLSGTNSATVQMGSDLTINGSLTINANTQLIARRENSGYNTQIHDLTVARSFVINANADYRAYNNTTTLLVTYTSAINLYNTNQDFFNLIIKNNPNYTATHRTIGGNSNTITIHNNLTIENGTVLRHANKNILVKGNIDNSGTIELTDPTTDIGNVQLSNRGIVTSINVSNGGNYTSAPTITIDAPTSGTTATAVPVFDGVPSSGNTLPITGIIITNSGSGYTSVPSVTISGSGGASATATINTQHTIGGNGSGVFGNLEVNEPHPATVSQKITYLTANQTVSNVFTLTSGILDLDTYNLDIYTLSTHGIANEETLYSETHLIRTSGNNSDGGLTRTIFADGTYLYPLGTYNSSASANRYGWAKPTISNYSDDGKIQINGVPQRLPTLGTDTPESYLQYYWRIRNNNFSTLPNIQHIFHSYVADYYIGAGNINQLRTGKVIDNVRYPAQTDPAIGELQGSNPIRNLYYYDYILETGEFTAARTNMFNGTVLIYYTRDHGTSTGTAAREPLWTDRFTWTRSDILIDANGDGTIDEKDWHNSSQPAAPDYPGIGDIAVIGWVPWDDPKTDLRGEPHGVWINNTTITVAKVEFTQMKDTDGNPVPRVYRSNFQFRPTLCINNTSGQLVAGMVQGEGMFWLRYSDPDFASTDLGDFTALDSTYFAYENNTDNKVYYNIPDNLSNIIMANDGWGANDRNVTISKSITTKGNFEILGDLNLLLNTGTTGDLTVGRNLVMYEFQGSEGSASGGGAELAFQNTGTARTLTVYGDIIMNNTGALIHVRSANAPAINHTINLYGSIIQNSANSTTDGIQLYSASDQDNVTLNLLGDENEAYNLTSGDTPSFYRIVVNKGSTQTPTFTFNNAFTLNGPTDGSTTNTKALELKNGTLILNNSGIDIILSSGGSDFEIPSTSGLSILNGTAQITTAGSNGLFLDGYLNIEGTDASNRGQLILDGGAGSDNYILYSSSGNAEMRIAAGKLVVGSQIRSSTENSLGVLKYSQLAKSGASGISSEVIVGLRSAPVNSRGVFEVFNPGSRFQIYNGTLTIVRPHDDVASETRAALYLDPTTTGLNQWPTIQIGDATNNPSGGTITVNSSQNLCSMVVDGNATAKLSVNNLGLLGNLNINSGSTFNGNSLNLTLYRNITNSGTVDLSVDTLTFIGNDQTIDGDITATNILVNPTTGVTLSGSTDTVTANNTLNIVNGNLSDNGHTIVVKGNLTNNAAHTSTGSGKILLNGTSLQHIYGTGQFGSLELDNAMGANLESNIFLNNDFTLTNGIFNINSHLFALSENSLLNGSGFGTSKMIITNGSFGDAGMKKFVPGTNFNFVFPIGCGSGVGAKYTPVEFYVSDNSSAGSITLHPVNQAHMTAVGPNVLQYYWTVNSSGISSLTGNVHFHYISSDVVGDSSLYYSARLEDDAWAKYPPETVDETGYVIMLDYTGVDDLSGDYTAGYDSDIPATIPVFISNGNGNWSDPTKWIRLDGLPVPAGGPQGYIVRIREEDTITMDRYRILSYKTQIFGRLEVGTEIGHNLGYVSGNGTLAFVNEKVYPGEYTDFLTCGTGGTVEFGGNSYDIPLFNSYSSVDDQFNNLVITGTGTKTFPDRDNIKICNNLSVLETATLKLEHYSRPNSSYKYTTVGGSILIGSTAFLDTDYGEYIKLAGNFTINSGGRFNSNYTYQFIQLNGVIEQIFEGDFTNSNQLNNFIVSNTKSWRLNGPVEILSFIYPYAGTYYTSTSNILTIKRSYGNGLQYPSTNMSVVEGPVKNNILYTTSYSVYPYLIVGKNNEKKFVTFTKTPTTANYFTGEYFGTNPNDAGMDPTLKTSPLQTVSGMEYWTIEGPSASTISARFTLPITTSSDICQGVSNVSNLRIAMWNGSSWVEVTSTPSSGSTKTSGTIETTSDFTFTAGTKYYFTIASTETIVIPTAQFSTGNQTICEGNSTSLEITMTGNGPWNIQYSTTDAYGTNSYTLTGITSPHMLTVSPTINTTYTIINVEDNIGTTGIVIGSNPVITVVHDPTPYNVTGTTTICGTQTATINLSSSQTGYTYDLYRNGATTGNTKTGTNGTLNFTGISLGGTYTIMAYRTGYTLCYEPMTGSAIITTSTGATITITGLATAEDICSDDVVQINLVPVGTPPFNFTINESYTTRTFDVTNLNATSGSTYVFTVTPPPTWINQGTATPYKAPYTYTVTNVSDNSGCGIGSGSGSVTVNVYKNPETGAQYHIPNNFGL